MSNLLALVFLACASAPDEGLSPVHAPEPSFDEIARSADRTRALVPSPLEMQHTLAASGLGASLAERVTASPPPGGGPDRAAVAAGVAIADVLLTARSATDEELATRLEAVRVGMRGLGAGPDIDATLLDQIARVRSHAVGRGELLDEFEELSQVAIPELTFHGQDRAVPLIEAGSWLRSAHLLAAALRDAGASDAPAASMLRAPTVVEYFQGYVASGDGARPPERVTAELREALAVLHRVAERPVLSDADLGVIVEVTGAVLALTADG